MVFQAPFGHELVDKQQFLVLPAVAQQLDKIRVREPSQKVYLWLQDDNQKWPLDTVVASTFGNNDSVKTKLGAPSHVCWPNSSILYVPELTKQK